MTLALYGKSPHRRVALLLGGLLAVVIATIAGLFALTAGDATVCACDIGNIQVHKYLPKDPQPESGQAPWQNQGVGSGTWTFTVYGSLADAQANSSPLATFSQLGSNSPDLPQQELWIKETGMPADQTFFGWFIPDGDNSSGNDHCNQAPLDGSTLDTSTILHIPADAWTTKGNKTGLFHVCAYDKPVTRSLRIVKVTDTATHPAADFGGTIQPYGGSTEPWNVSLAANAGSIEVTKTISAAEYQMLETSSPAGWNLVGYQVKADPSGTGTCVGSFVDTATIPSGSANYLACVKNSYTPVTHTIEVCKVVEQNNDGVDQGGNFSGEIRHWTAAAGFTAVPWSVTGVVEGGEPVCTTVASIPADHTFNVTEFGFRPGAWVADASGFPWYEDDKGMTHSANVTTVNYTADVKVTFHNKSNSATRNVQVCKVAVGNGDGVSVPAFGYGFDIRPTGSANISGSNSVAEPTPDTNDSQTAEICTTKQVPTDKSFDVVEWMSRPSGWTGDAVGYPKYQINGGALYTNNTTTPIAVGTSDVKVTFFNKELPRSKGILIVKSFTGLNGYTPGADDYPTFSFVPEISPTPVCVINESKLPDSVSWTCTVPASWNGTVNESTVPNWETATGCPLVASLEGGPQVFSFCNRPYGTIEIIKFDNTTAGNLDRPADGDWDFNVTGPNSFSADLSMTFGSGGISIITHVPLGAGYTAAETDARYGQCSTVSNPTGQGYNTTDIWAGPGDLTVPGALITFAFRNDDCGIVLGTGQLHIWKVRDVLGDGALNGPDGYVPWNVTITGPEFPAGQNFAVPATGLHFGGLTEGLYTISEATQFGWNNVGVTTTEHSGLVASASTQVDLRNSDDDTVTFFNQPFGEIPVQKEAFTSHNGGPNVPAPGDDDGWTITVKSAACGVNTSLVTDANGQALFSQLPMCTDYVVSEAATNADSPGFVPLTASQFTNVTPNGVTLTFNNILRTSEPFNPVTPVPTTPPTATPATPTTTPVEPTNTPVTPPATAIAGEKTPGPGQPTPVVPSTGNTGGNGGTGTNIIVIVGALLTLATAFGTTALALRRTR